ncbi:subtilisin-like protein, partial [Byssothecium circinans]
LRGKGVKNIIKVTVEDRHPPCHSDYAIETALKCLEIDILDWKKADICSETILEACPQIRQLHLWWSGLNGMLRSWSSEDGLAQLSQLTDIHLHQIHVTHQWFDTMDPFADYILTFDHQSRLNRSKIINMLKNEIRVCLIDDGVNMERRNLKENMETRGKSFHKVPSNGTPEEQRVHYASTADHGTLMANMIRRICPHVKITSYRLDVVQHVDGSRPHFTALSAAEAVEDASAQNFDIISMSWTIQRTRSKEYDNENLMDRLKKALESAHDNGALLFCAAPDSGNVSNSQFDDYYPIGSRARGIFKIGAAMAEGQAWPWAGGSTHLDYVLPGYEVRDRQDLGMKKNTPRSGSSIATALASGLAALIIHCVRLAALDSYEKRKGLGDDIPLKKLEEVKTFDAMNRIFSKMAQMDKGGARYIHVWNTFETHGSKLK